MALVVNVHGAALVRVGTGAANALEDLGYSVNGVDIEETVLTADVPGDQNGGDEGPPIDIQYFGQIDIVRLELSRYDAAVLAKIDCRLLGGTTGSTSAPGTLIFGASRHYRLLVHPTTGPRNYLGAVPRQAILHNRGTKFSRLRLEFECHAVSGVLWNTATT